LGKEADLEVNVIMTKAAAKFVAPLTFRTLSGRDVITSLWHEDKEGAVQHISVAEKMDLMVIAPATANIIAKMAAGIADDILSTIILANTAPLLIFPSMNTNMYLNKVTQRNISILKEIGYEVIEPASGHLACGVSGPGRLPEVDVIFDIIKKRLFTAKHDLKGKKFLINAGTTCEDIDPIRYIANRGTGKMGFAIAAEVLDRGGEVILVSGPTHVDPPYGCELFNVWSAEDMCRVMLEKQNQADVIIGAAAVGDFKSAQVNIQKIKKEGINDSFSLELTHTPDILKLLGEHRKNDQVIVGFAAETENIMDNAYKKMANKKLDMIVANDVTAEGAGFAVDTNIVTIITKEGAQAYPLMTKRQVAEVIIDKALEIAVDSPDKVRI
jgi:phosphopantothenoylcysteine decarboxylase/phosphopantothenate--cysteine ligase